MFRGRFNDKPSLRVDDWPLSPHSGNVYVSWTLYPGVSGREQIHFARSIDHGVTFSRPIKVSPQVFAAQGSDIAVAPDGTVYVAWRQFGTNIPGVADAIVIARSTNAGETFKQCVACGEGLSYCLNVLGVDGWAALLFRLVRWPLIAVIVGTAISVIYRFGPDREHAQWRWLSWGAILSTFVWMVTSAGFTFYLSNFADYNATYGALGAVAGLMIWIWISVIILILGAELNAELEHQTATDTTTGDPVEMGKRRGRWSRTRSVNPQNNCAAQETPTGHGPR